MKNIHLLAGVLSSLWDFPSRAAGRFSSLPRRLTRVEHFGRGKGRNRRIHFPRVPLACRWDYGAKTEVCRVGNKFVVETVGETFRAKKTFPTEREALNYFHEEDV